jgi:hypothetical protein
LSKHKHRLQTPKQTTEGTEKIEIMAKNNAGHGEPLLNLSKIYHNSLHKI